MDIRDDIDLQPGQVWQTPKPGEWRSVVLASINLGGCSWWAVDSGRFILCHLMSVEDSKEFLIDRAYKLTNKKLAIVDGDCD